MEMKIENINSVSKFTKDEKEYFSVVTSEINKDTNKYEFKSYLLNSDLDEIEQTPELTVVNNDGNKLSSKEQKIFIKKLSEKFNEIEKAENKAQKQDEKQIKKDILAQNTDTFMKDYYSIKNLDDRIKYLESKGIKEGNVYKIKTVAINEETGEKEQSYAFVEVFKSNKKNCLCLKDANDEFNKNDTSFYQIANAEKIAGTEAIALLSARFATNRLRGCFVRDTKQPQEKFDSYKIDLNIEDITEDVLKKRKELAENKKKADSDEKESFSQKVILKKVPDRIKDIYKEKNRDIDEIIYTNKCYQMFKRFASIPNEDRNMSEFDKKVFGNLLAKMSAYNDNESKQRQVFDQWIFDHDRTNNDKIICMANLFEKTHKEDFKGYEKNRSEFTKQQREKDLEAIKNNALPFMQPKKEVDYIYNPETNEVYKGSTQLALARNNNMNNYKTDAYANLPALFKQTPLARTTRLAAEIVEMGNDEFGHRRYQILLPVKPTLRERIEEMKARKMASKMRNEIREEEYRRTLFDAKMQRKYGELPVFQTQVQPVPTEQPKVVDKTKVKNPYERPTNESTIENKVKYDCASYFISMFTKEPFEPATDWNKEENRKELEDFVRNNPEKYTNIQDESYKTVQSQIHKAYNNTNTNVNENTNEKINEQTKGKTKTR